MDFLKKKWWIIVIALLIVRPAWSIIPIRPSIIPKAIYVYGTHNTETYTISKTHNKINPMTKTDQYLVWAKDENKNPQEFKVVDSWFYGNLLSSRLWGQLEQGKKYKISYYGWRWGIFSLYPNITDVESVQ